MFPFLATLFLGALSAVSPVVAEDRFSIAHGAPTPDPREATLLSSRFSFSIAGKDLACASGQLGGDYPSPTIVTLTTATGVGALREVRGLGTPPPVHINAPIARHLDSKRSCAALKSVLVATSHAGEGSLKITEGVYRSPAGDCSRALQETLSLRVAGLTFEGRARFIVAPADGCAPLPAK
jgi:hypothetical protein